MTITNVTVISRQLDLGKALRLFAQDQKAFIADRVAPIIPVPHESATFQAVTRESMLAEPADEKVLASDDSSTPLVTTSLADITYRTQKYKLGERIPDRSRKRVQPGFDYEQATVQKLARLLMVKREKRVKAALFNTSIFTGAALTTDISGSAPFATKTSLVRTAVRTALQKVELNCGATPDMVSMVLNRANFEYLKNNDELRDDVKYNDFPSDEAVAAAIAKWLGIKDVLIGAAITNSANKGQTFAGSAIWPSTYASLAVLGTSGDIAEPAVMKTPLWTDQHLDRDPNGNVVDRMSIDPFEVEMWYDADKEGWIYRVKHDVAEHVTDSGFAHLLKVA